MKILITQYQMMDLGGIVGDLEALVLGLQELGNEVTVRQLCWKNFVQDQRSMKDSLKKGNFGLMHDQTGWIWPASHRIAYRGLENLKRWKEYANQFDLVIWHIPVVSMNKENQGNSDWLELYELNGPRQIAYVHDGNLRDSYPHIFAIKKHLSGLACTQGAALGSCQYIDVPSALVRSGQTDIAARWNKRFPHAARRRGFFSCFTAKGWKHLEDLVRAVPHMLVTNPKIYAGDGITARYMRAEEKCPNQFKGSRQYDPDIMEQNRGQKIWDTALKYGFEWWDYIHPDKRDEQMVSIMCHIDPSWSIKYAKLGSHFNRTTVEAMIAGCVPVARNLGLGTDNTGVTEIWKPNENYIMIPSTATPREFANIVDYAANIPIEHYNRMLGNWDRIIVDWDYIRVAERLMQLVLTPEHFHKGLNSYDLQQKSELALTQHFGV